MRGISPLAFALCGALVLSGCTGWVNVPSVSIATPSGMQPVPGKYAAWIQSGGWKLDVKTQSDICSIWSFDADINQSYRSAMTDALTRGLEHVDFIETTLTPDDLKKQGYDAQIILYQGNATAEFGVSQNLFSGSAGAGVSLTTTLAVIRKQGLAYQVTVSGEGRGGKDVFGCETIGDAIAAAAASAIQDTGTKSVLYVRDAIRSSDPAAVSGNAAPAIPTPIARAVPTSVPMANAATGPATGAAP